MGDTLYDEGCEGERYSDRVYRDDEGNRLLYPVVLGGRGNGVKLFDGSRVVRGKVVRELESKDERAAYLRRLAELHARADAYVKERRVVWPKPGEVVVVPKKVVFTKLKGSVSIHKCCGVCMPFVGRSRMRCGVCGSVYLMYLGKLHKEK